MIQPEKFRNTTRQQEIMRAVLKAADAGKFLGTLDLRKLLPEVSELGLYGTLRTLRGAGLIEFEGPKNSWKKIKPTMEAYNYYRRGI